MVQNLHVDSYHIDYGGKAAACVDAYMQNINWQDVAMRYQSAKARKARPSGLE